MKWMLSIVFVNDGWDQIIFKSLEEAMAWKERYSGDIYIEEIIGPEKI